MIQAIEDEIDFCEYSIKVLEKERFKITKRGLLTAEQDRRLDEIDSELRYWLAVLDNLEDEWDYMSENDNDPAIQMEVS